VLTSFLPSAYVAAKAPACANAACTAITLGTGDPLNGIIVAGRNSPYGRAVYAFDKTNIQPRIGVTWDPNATGKTFYRASYGVYYDQALVGIFEQNSFTNPPYVTNAETDALPREYSYEPELGLRAGDDGLDLALKILRDAPLHLTDDGLLICEVGEAEQALAKLLPELPLAWVEFKVGQMGVFVAERHDLVTHNKRIRKLADARP